MRGRKARALTLVAGAAIIAMLVANAAFDAGPLHAASCLFGGRDGWNVEYPPGLETPAEVEALIREETTCVPIDLLYVNYNEVPEGQLITDPCCRDWLRHDEPVILWVEGSPEQALERCRLEEPDMARRVDCPGGPVSGKLAPGH